MSFQKKSDLVRAFYAADKALEKTSEPFLVGHHGQGGLVRKKVEAYDLDNPGLRDWWVDALRTVAADPVIDGVFLDGNVKVLEPDYLRSQIGPARKLKLVAGYRTMMAATREAIGPTKLMIANVLRARFPDSGLGELPPFDGTYVEGFETATGGLSREDYLAKGIAAVQATARRGAIVAFTFGAGNEVAEDTANPQMTDEIRERADNSPQTRQRFLYCLAMFLVCAERHSYFLFHDGYDVMQSSQWMKWPDEYSKPLGAPKGPAIREGVIYTREFEHASVRLDLKKQEGRITWGR
jgi:hypothetical protein